MDLDWPTPDHDDADDGDMSGSKMLIVSLALPLVQKTRLNGLR